MAIFAYVAKDKAGKMTRGRVEADDEKALVTRLREVGSWIIQLKLVPPQKDAEIMDRALRDLYHKGRMTYDDAITCACNPAKLEGMMLNAIEDSQS